MHVVDPAVIVLKCCREARRHARSRRASPVAHEVSTTCSGRRQGSVSRVPAKWTSTPDADFPIHLACGRCGSTSSRKEDQEELALLRGCGVWSMARVALLLLYVSGVFELARTLLVELDARPPFFCGGRGRLAMSRGCALQLLSHPLLTFSTHLASARCVFDEACSWTSLLTAYARAGQLNEARSLFDGMPHKTPVAWSAMLSAYVGAGGFADALEVFDGMLRARVRPNRAAFVGALAACGALRALEQGRWVHALVTGSGVDGVVATTLVDMHAKWGSLEAATQVFAAMLERERDTEAVELFGRMQDRGVRPNEITFICVLDACARAGSGLVGVTKEIFRTMPTVHGIEPEVEHYGSMVDVLGRAGLLAEAVGLVIRRRRQSAPGLQFWLLDLGFIS
nr:pentatricopeptide repeat-containing protein At4g18840-like [Lolium perenne]